MGAEDGGVSGSLQPCKQEMLGAWTRRVECGGLRTCFKEKWRLYRHTQPCEAVRRTFPVEKRKLSLTDVESLAQSHTVRSVGAGIRTQAIGLPDLRSLILMAMRVSLWLTPDLWHGFRV